MKTVKVGNELIECIMMAYYAGRAFMLVGNSGIGKSEIILQAAAALGIHCIVRDLSVMEAVELAGLPKEVNNKTTYAAPSFLPTAGKGLLVFEEINRAEEHVRVPCLQLLTARSINDYVLPEGWIAAAAINPPGEYHVDELDPALMARFVKIQVSANKADWIKWAEQNDVHPKVCAFVQATPKIFDAAESSPRAWKYASDILIEFEARSYSKQALVVLLAGIVGDELSRAFFEFYFAADADIPPSPDQVLKSYSSYAKQVRSWAANGKTAVLDSLCQQLLVHLESPAVEQAVKGNAHACANLAKLHHDLPAEFRAKLDRYAGHLLRNVRAR